MPSLRSLVWERSSGVMNNDALPSNKLLSRPEAARFLGISTRQIGNLIAAGAISHVRIGRSVRFRVRDLEEFVESRTVHNR